MITDRERFEVAILGKQPGENKSQVAREYNIAHTNVRQYLKYFNREYGRNEHIRHQVLLGSKLGDGYFQRVKNGKYVYRESHGLGEFEYAAWKYLILDDMTDGMSIITKNHGQAVEISTSTRVSDKIKKYAEMSFDDVIKDIDIYGLLVYIMDDGWYSNHSKMGNFIVGSKKLDICSKNKIANKFSEYHIKTNIIGRRKDISIDSSANKILWAYLDDMMFTRDIDIIHKKFGKIEKQILY